MRWAPSLELIYSRCQAEAAMWHTTFLSYFLLVLLAENEKDRKFEQHLNE